MGSSSVTGGKDAFSSGVAGIIDMAKGMVQGGLGTTQSALVGTKEAVSGGVTEAVGMAKGLVQGGLDTSKTVLSTTRDTVTTGLTGAMNVAKGTVQTGLDTSKNVLTGTKDTVCAGVTGAINVAKGAAQGGLDTPKAALTGTKTTMLAGLSGTMNMATETMKTGLDTSKSMLTGTKDTVCAGITGAMIMAKGVFPKGLHTPKDTWSAMRSQADNVTINATHTGVNTVPCSLSGSHATTNGVEHVTLTSAESLCSEISSLADTCVLGLVTEPIAATKGLVSNVASSVHAATKSEEECGQLAVTSFAALHDELEGLGDIFQPMTAKEQGECLSILITGPQPQLLDLLD